MGWTPSRSACSSADPPGQAGCAPLDVVIPTLDAAATLGATLASLAEGCIGQVIVADGGSADGTCRVAEDAGALVLHAPRGRGPQLRAGAAAAWAPWLLFLHADTRLAPGWAAEAARFMAWLRTPAPAISACAWTTAPRRRGGWSGSSPGAAAGRPCPMATRAC